MMSVDGSPEQTVLEDSKDKTRRNVETGIIYLSRIPTLMCVKKVRQIFSVYGEIGRIFLQPDEKVHTRKKQQQFSEGWVEFADKRKAKRIARTLNNTKIGGKRKSPWYDEIWNIKYLPKFKWGHLNERLSYEREVHKQRLRTEVAQAKRETAFYKQNVERRQIQRKLQKKGGELDSVKRDWSFVQRKTEAEIVAKKRKHSQSKGKDSSSKSKGKRTKSTDSSEPKPSEKRTFLKSIFAGGLQASSDEEG